MPTQVTGQLNYLSPTAVELHSQLGIFLLAVDRPPLGAFDPGDVRAAAEFLRDVLGKAQGDQSTILGVPFSPAPGRNALGIVRVLA